jgi:hypothetical protein
VATLLQRATEWQRCRAIEAGEAYHQALEAEESLEELEHKLEVQRREGRRLLELQRRFATSVVVALVLATSVFSQYVPPVVVDALCLPNDVTCLS